MCVNRMVLGLILGMDNWPREGSVHWGGNSGAKAKVQVRREGGRDREEGKDM